MQISLFALLVVVALLQFRFAYQAQLEFTLPTGKLNTEVMRDAYKLTYLAKQKHLFDADLEGAHQLLSQTLLKNPLYIPAWLSLAELYYDKGELEKAISALDYSSKMLIGLKRWRWEKSLTAYQMGILEDLPGELSYIIKEIPGKNRQDALKLAFSMWKKPHELLENIGVENTPQLFDYAIRSEKVDESIFLWEAMHENNLNWQETDILRFINMLMNNRRIEEAALIWRELYNPNDLIYNGSFSQTFISTAFGWRNVPDKDFISRLIPVQGSDDEYALEYRFRGWKNTRFNHLFQIVPLDSGKEYLLSAEIKSEKLTTDQRPFLEVQGFKCKAPYAASEMVRPNQDWTTHQLIFVLPEECSAAVVKFRRKESLQLDNKLSGKVWLRNVNLVENK